MKKPFDAVRQNQLANDFRALHHAAKTLVLVNAWDAASARIVAEGGYPAIATTSSGISWASGCQDGEHISPQLMINILQRIAAAVAIPVSADIEAGYYGENMDKFRAFIGEVIEAGIVGINLEDVDIKNKTLRPVDQQTEVIAAAKAVGEEKGVNVFVNARSDAMALLGGGVEEKANECIRRAKAFEGAGADGIFIPFVEEMATVKKLKQDIGLPLNILNTPKLKVAELKELGVNRISTGSQPIIATLSLMKKIAGELMMGNDWTTLSNLDTNYPEINNFFG